MIYFATVIVLLMMCFRLYDWINANCADRIRDWFNENLMTSYVVTDAYGNKGGIVNVTEPRWHAIREKFRTALCVTAVVWVTSIFAAAWIYSDRRVKRTMADTSKLVRSYMMDHHDITDISQEDNPELLAQMVEIKSAM